jgi:hypothetical protein
MMVELAVASWETIARRTAMIARGQPHCRGISAHGDRESRCVTAIGNRRDDLARQESGARAIAQARHGERAAAAPENLSNKFAKRDARLRDSRYCRDLRWAPDLRALLAPCSWSLLTSARDHGGDSGCGSRFLFGTRWRDLTRAVF